MLAKALASATAAAPKTYVEDVFSTWLYTGNGSTQTITNGIDLSGKGGLVWIKARNIAVPHALFDTQRGATYMLQSQSTAAQALWSDSLTSYGSTGFSLGADTNAQNVNFNNDTYASWTFRKAEKFFDVVTYTGTGSTQAIPHNLGSVPGMYICKSVSSTGDWNVYHRGLSGANKYLVLNSTAAEATSGSYWDSQAPTATQFYVGNNNATNTNGVTYVAYLFAHDAGGFGDAGTDSVVKCGSYTGTGSPGLAVTLGFEPQWVMVKNASSGSYMGWFMFDNMRGMAVGDGDPYFYAQSSMAEAGATSDYINPTATGFTLNNASQVINESGNTYIYIAIRRGPMKTPTVGTEVFDVDLQTAGGTVTTGFPVDTSFAKLNALSGYNPLTFSRLTGARNWLYPNTTDAEQSAGSDYWLFGNNTGVKDSFYGGSNSVVYWNFRRAPGFFDVVAYTGTGANQQVTHNLGVVPEMMIIKSRSGAFGWAVYHSGMSTDLIELQSNTFGSSANPNWWDNGAPTSTLIKTPSGSNAAANRIGDAFVAYLFASCLGVSKVGSYTGTGTTLSIDCGFTTGARFVLIRRKDAGGDWYVWDTARGIISGNDPYLLLNSTAAEVTNTDYIDPLNSGFEISSTAPSAINASGGSYIFLAIA